MRWFSIFYLLISILSCTKEVDDISPLSVPEQLVLNGILHPDSIIRITLTKTIAVADARDFPIIPDATVKVYEDDQLIGNLVFQDSLYSLAYYPKEGKRYTVEASVPKYETLYASDVVPFHPVAEACFKKDTTQYSYTDASFDVSIYDNSSEENFYWLYSTYTSYDARMCEVEADSLLCEGGVLVFLDWRDEYYQSFSTVPDPFNSFINTIAGGVREYDGYVRISDQSLNDQVIVLNIAPPGNYRYLASYRTIHDSLTYSLVVTNASQHYDRYLKSSVTYYLNNEYGGDDARPNLFAEPTRIYSNVENGTGIFAAYNSASIEIGDFPCP